MLSMRIFVFIIVLALIAGCSSNKTAAKSQTNEEFTEKIIKDNFGGKSVEKKFNSSRDLVVLINKIDRGTGFPDVTELIVLDLKRKKIVYEESVIEGSVSWKDDDIIIVKRTAEVRSIKLEENSNTKYREINIRKL